ncbi:MAG: 2,3-bisphosphoglycerate-independent phosphoglycerate mutase [Rhodospirillales bacterium]|nr:2,3-bisphosphoglycerate-independent phosphoglycerate mutase [Rhodospirillales bacterium]
MGSEHAYRPVVLCVLDGWGHREETDHNAIALAETPVWDRLCAARPYGLLATAGAAVGLPEGQMGNSEVGHMTIGAGRVILQDLPRIDAAVADGSLAQNPTLLSLIERLRESGGRCHLMGLVSPGGVHSHQDQITALARIVSGAGVPVAIHAFLDGRDVPPRSAIDDLPGFEDSLVDLPNVRIATVTGRYYAMDRDRRWERTTRAYDALVSAQGRPATDATTAVAESYAGDIGDEFVEPAVITGYRGMADGDGLVMANFRADRARQIMTALLDPAFDGFARTRRASIAAACGMCSYSETLDRLAEPLFPPLQVTDHLGEVVSRAGLRQLRVAETEKYAHVTFFLNGGEEKEMPGEERVLVPSPKVATYDLQPEMSARAVTDRAADAIAGGRFDLIVVNYANTDMVGHSGNLDAAMAAVAAVDRCLGRLAGAVEEAGGALLITADHGNAEQMLGADDKTPHTAHTDGPVPAVLVGAPGLALGNGGLPDIAPTVLDLMGVPAPAAMTGRSLTIPEPAEDAARVRRRQPARAR